MDPHIDRDATEGEQDEVMNWLRAFNESTNGAFMTSLAEGAERPVFLVARDAEGNVTGGLQGTILHQWLKIELMAVSPDERRKGVGRRLVEAAEAWARELGCLHTYVDTMSFQAPGFYEGLGFEETGRLRDWDSHGHDKIFFVKPLA